MIELATAAAKAKLASDVSAVDKIFRGYSDFIENREPLADAIPPPEFAYMDSPQKSAIVAKSLLSVRSIRRLLTRSYAVDLSDPDRLEHASSGSEGKREASE